MNPILLKSAKRLCNRLNQANCSGILDALLVNSVFTSIYFIGALTAELTSSLPNYKETYVPIGPRLIQQLFRTAIGEDAFRDNLTANLDAYKTVATTAGLLRPTDIGYSTFPRFPSFSPSRYSNKSLLQVKSNKIAYDRLCKHFERFGFPQPNQNWQPEVGIIREWKFLTGDTNSQIFDVEKADKNIGENFGRVIHWLVCSADRLPPGQAIIAYYEQHIELIKWIGNKMGYYLLQPFVDLNMTGAHAQLEHKLKAVMNTWVIIMPSERARVARHAIVAKWTEDRERIANQAQKLSMPPPQAFQRSAMPANQSHSASSMQLPTAAPVATPNMIQTPTNLSTETPTLIPTSNVIEAQINEINAWFNTQLKPQCQAFLKMPPPDLVARDLERRRLTELTEKGVILRLDALQIHDGHPAREYRKAMIVQAQKMLASLDSLGALAPSAPGPLNSMSVPLTSASVSPQAAPPQETSGPQPSTSNFTSSAISPPPYSPAISSIANSDTPLLEKRKTVIRRKAPPPPKKPTAKALYDFDPDGDNEEELAFKEGNDLVIVEKTAAMEAEGWCLAKLIGTKKCGLVPLEYLEITTIAVQPTKPTASTQAVNLGSNALPAQLVNMNIASAQTSSTLQGTPAPVPQNTNSSGNQTLSGSAHNEPIKVKNNIGKWEIAGLSIAGVGAAAGVTSVLQGAPEQTTHTQIKNVQPRQNPSNSQNQTASDGANDSNPLSQPSDDQALNGESSNSQGQNNQATNPPDPNIQTSNIQHQPLNNDPNAYITSDPAHTANPEQPTSTNESAVTTTTTTDSTTSDYFFTPPGTNLSAYDGSGSNFSPQTSTITEPNPVADLAAVNPYYAAMNPTVASAPDLQSALNAQEATAIATDTAAVGNVGPVSPFASMATQPSVDGGEYSGMQDPVTISSPFAGLATQPAILNDVVGENVSSSTAIAEEEYTVDGGVESEVETVEEADFFDME